MDKNHNGINDEICMAFLKSKSELALKEGDENRVHNSIALDKSDLAIGNRLYNRIHDKTEMLIRLITIGIIGIFMLGVFIGILLTKLNL